MKSDSVTGVSQIGSLARIALLGVVLGLGGPVHGQQGDAASRALRKAQGMLRQLASEKKALEAEIQEKEGELAKASAELSQVQAEVLQQQSMNSALVENNAALVERIKTDHQKIQAIIEKYRALQAELRLYQQDHALLINAVGERDQWISDCRKKNAELIAEGKELLIRYNNKSVWDAIVESEPALGIGAVDAEMEDQDLRFKLEDLQVQPPETGALPSAVKDRKASPAGAPAKP